MVQNLTEAQINAIVAKVVAEYKSAPAANAVKKDWDATQYKGRKLVGVYETMEEAIEVANAGYKAVRSMSVADREKIITSIRNFTRAEAMNMAELGVAETKMGRVDHKIAKHNLVADKTPGTEDIIEEAKTGDNGIYLFHYSTTSSERMMSVNFSG